MTARRVVVFAPSYYGIDRSIEKAFKRSGFDTRLVNYRAKMYLIEKLAYRLSLKLRFFSPFCVFIKVLLFIEGLFYVRKIVSFAPDMLFIVKGECLLPSSVKMIKSKGIKIISYQWDDPFFMYPEQIVWFDQYRRGNFLGSIDLFDHIFVYDKYYVEKLERMGAANASFLPLATDEEVYFPAVLDEAEKREYGYDLCFVGGPFDNRVELFNDLKDLNLGVFGDGWEKWSSGIKGNYFKGKAHGEKTLKLYSASKIVLNIHHRQSVTAPNTRTFDIPACGAFEITDHKESMASMFDIGKEIVCYHDNEELKSLIRYYLEDDEKRGEIARKGRERVLREHTWTHRVKQAMDVLYGKKILD